MEFFLKSSTGGVWNSNEVAHHTEWFSILTKQLHCYCNYWFTFFIFDQGEVLVLLRQTGMFRQKNGLVLCKKSLNMSPIFRQLEKSRAMGLFFENFCGNILWNEYPFSKIPLKYVSIFWEKISLDIRIGFEPMAAQSQPSQNLRTPPLPWISLATWLALI